MRTKLKIYFVNVLVGFDIFVNTLTGGAPGDTISGRTARAARHGWKWAIALRWFLNHLQKNHVENAEKNDFSGDGRHKEAIAFQHPTEETTVSLDVK